MASGLCLIVYKSLGPQCAMLPAELGNKTSSLIHSLLMRVGELWWSLLSVQDPTMASKKRKYSDLTTEASLVAQRVKASACSAGDLGSIPGSGRSRGEGNGNPLQYSCLENSMNGGAWWATVHGVTKSRTWLSYFTFFFSFTAQPSSLWLIKQWWKPKK